MSADAASRGRIHKVKAGHGRRVEIGPLRFIRDSDAVLAQYLPLEIPATVLHLFAGNSPVLPLVLQALAPACRQIFFELDLHDAAAARRRFPDFQVLCAADLPEIEAGLVLMSIDDHCDRQLLFDTIERLNLSLPDRTPILISIPSGRQKDLYKKASQVLHGATILGRSGGYCVMGARTRRDNAHSWTPREARFHADSTAGTLELRSRPGVFSHGRADTGGIALAESVQVLPGESMMDLGAGCGLVGLLLRQAQIKLESQSPGSTTGSILLVDSHLRALECAQASAAALGLSAVQTLACEQVTGMEGFDLVVGNPPYYADRRIALYFVSVAAASLRPGGRTVMVSKHGDELAQMVQEAGFINITTLHRRGYDITLAAKPS